MINHNILLYFIVITIPTHIFSMEKKDEKGYHSDTDTQNRSKIVRKTKTTVVREPKIKQRIRSSTVFGEQKMNVIPPHEPKTDDIPTRPKLLSDANITFKYIAGKRTGNREQLVAMKFFETLLKNSYFVDEETKQSVLSHINNFFIQHHDRKCKAYFESCKRIEQQAKETSDDKEKSKLLFEAKKKLDAASRHLSSKTKLSENDETKSEQYKEIASKTESLKQKIDKIPMRISHEIILQEAHRKELKAQKHMDLADILRSKTLTNPPQEHIVVPTQSKTLTTGLLTMLREKKDKLDKKNKRSRKHKKEERLILKDFQQSPEEQKLEHAQTRIRESAHLILTKAKPAPEKGSYVIQDETADEEVITWGNK